MRDDIHALWLRWDDGESQRIAAVNLFRDASAAQRRVEIQQLKDDLGECQDAGPVIAENWLRAQFNIRCTRGTVGVFFTLSPTQPPRVQHLSFRKLDVDSARLGAPTGAPAGVSCSD
jgi:hypothetical protein